MTNCIIQLASSVLILHLAHAAIDYSKVPELVKANIDSCIAKAVAAAGPGKSSAGAIKEAICLTPAKTLKEGKIITCLMELAAIRSKIANLEAKLAEPKRKEVMFTENDLFMAHVSNAAAKYGCGKLLELFVYIETNENFVQSWQ